MHCTVACALVDGPSSVLLDRGYVILVRVTALHCTACTASRLFAG